MRLTPKILSIILVLVIIISSFFIISIYHSPGYHNTSNGKIQFRESGLLSDTNWTVSVTGVDYTQQETTNQTEMNFSALENGIYSYSINTETGYSLSQSGQTNASGNSGIVEIGDIYASQNSGYNTYPLQIKVMLNFTMLTPSMSSEISETSNPNSYHIIVLSVSWSINLSFVNVTAINSDKQNYTLTLYKALNKEQDLAGIWDVNVSGPNYLSGNTVISFTEITGTYGDSDVSQFIFSDVVTGGIIGTISG
jgi:hypothetical protein